VTKPQWIVAAREAVADMWSEYKYRANNNSTALTELTLSVVDEDDEWSGDDTALIADQL
jgi:hypothetical protein